MTKHLFLVVAMTGLSGCTMKGRNEIARSICSGISACHAREGKDPITPVHLEAMGENSRVPQAN